MGALIESLASEPIAVLGLLVAAGGFVGALLVRRAQGKPLLAPSASTFEFAERWTSGRSLGSWWARLGRANNCLLVGIRGDRLLVQPHFPFNQWFVPEMFGLEHDVAVKDITRLASRPGLFRESLIVEYRDRAMESRALELSLRDPDALLAALSRSAPRKPTSAVAPPSPPGLSSAARMALTLVCLPFFIAGILLAGWLAMWATGDARDGTALLAFVPLMVIGVMLGALGAYAVTVFAVGWVAPKSPLLRPSGVVGGKALRWLHPAFRATRTLALALTRYREDSVPTPGSGPSRR